MYGLVNKRAEGNAPLTVQALVDEIMRENDSPKAR